jgi:hypothetical protein
VFNFFFPIVLLIFEKIDKYMVMFFSLSSLTAGNCSALGWLAEAPQNDEGPTSHYLRSPIGTNLYLGGPLSLCNWAWVKTSEATVSPKKSSSSLIDSKYLYYVTTIRPLDGGTEVLWNYGIRGASEFPFPCDSASLWSKVRSHFCKSHLANKHNRC